MQRTTFTIDGHAHVLAQGTQLGTLKTSVEDAVRAGGRFVDLTVLGNVAVSVLVSPGVSMFFTTREVADDARDTGNVGEPYIHMGEWEVADLY